MNDIEIPVKEATQKGYAIAKGGGATVSIFQSQEARPEGEG